MWRDLFHRPRTASKIARDMIARGNRARDGGNYSKAALLYEEALRIRPRNARIHIQCGHMLKETGDLANAERHYLEADRLMPNNADLALQFGHFYKIAGRLDRSAEAYRRALELQPHWWEPARELEQLTGNLESNPNTDANPSARQEDGTISRLVPELAPRTPHGRRPTYLDAIHINRLGTRERSAWGVLPTLRGVQAMRGFCIASIPIVDLQITVGGRLVYEGPLQGHAIEGGENNQRKYVFNVWHDFSGFAYGGSTVEFRFVDEKGRARSQRVPVVIAAPLTEAQFPGCDALVSLGENDPRPAEEQINSRPSVVRSAKRNLAEAPIRNVLVQRTDQLGDLVYSVPAIRRLRRLLPDAHTVGLLTPANAELAGTLALFDEIVVVDFPDDPAEGRRVMPLDKQEALRQRLEPYHFDLAIDLSVNSMSRPLLRLSGARILYGFQAGDWPWLSAGFEARTYDRLNHQECVPTSTRVLGLIERLGAMLKSRAEVVRRADLTREMLKPYGLEEDSRFAVLHDGARLAFSRWPYYPELASLLLARTDLKVILLTDASSMKTSLRPDVLASKRFRLLEGRLPFDDLDALLSFCAVFVGNDSGPKHLAALRGAKVVSIHSARINWNEMGQELSGVIISRKVPCAGCGIDYNADECGKDYACIVKISPEEVFDAVMALLQRRASNGCEFRCQSGGHEADHSS